MRIWFLGGIRPSWTKLRAGEQKKRGQVYKLAHAA